MKVSDDSRKHFELLFSTRYLILKLLTGDAMEEYCSQNSCRVSVGDVGGAKTRYAIS